MKKFLSLVLALVMTMSLVTVSAGAKDFTDSSKIQYKEAIDVMSAVKVIDGYADGAFNPANTLTRGAAAKIICNLILGPTTASALVADAAPYKDVPTSNVFAGYIAYCQKEGIISGYADGTFRPAATLTGYAFMKMLLGALGYDATIEGYTGANWSINVAKRALNIGLDDGLVDDFNGVKAVTREEACLYAFNMLQATMVEYDSTTNITVGGAQVVIAGSKAKDVETNSDKATIKAGGTVQFAEKYFDKLQKNRGGVARDDFGRPATTWHYKKDKIGTYANTPDVVYTKSVKLTDVYNDLGMSDEAHRTYVYVNSKDVAHTYSSADAENVQRDTSKKLKDLDSKIGNGTTVEVYLDDDTNDVSVCAISNYTGEITKVSAATAKKDANVTVDAKSSVPASFSAHKTFETTGFEEDDIVSFTYSESATEIKSMVKLSSVEGTLTERAIGTSLTLGGTTYKYAKTVAWDNVTEAGMNSKSDYKVYLDANGYVAYVTETEFVAGNYALVNRITNAAGGWVGDKAELILADGSKKIVDLDKDYVANSAVVAGDIVSFKVNDGEYKLNKVSSGLTNKWSNDSTFTVSKRNASFTVNGTTVKADSKTIFVVSANSNASMGDFKVYTGIKNAPNIAANANTQVSVYEKNSGVATLVFVATHAANIVTQSSKDVVYVAGKSVSDELWNADDDKYYTYNAVVNGKITTVNVKNTETLGGNTAYETLVAGAKNNAVFNGTTEDDGLLVSATTYTAAGGTVSVLSGTSIKKISGEYSVKLNGALLTLADDVKVYYVDEDGVIAEIAPKDITTDGDDTFIYTFEDGEITNLFIQEVNP